MAGTAAADPIADQHAVAQDERAGGYPARTIKARRQTAAL